MLRAEHRRSQDLTGMAAGRLCSKQIISRTPPWAAHLTNTVRGPQGGLPLTVDGLMQDGIQRVQRPALRGSPLLQEK